MRLRIPRGGSGREWRCMALDKDTRELDDAIAAARAAERRAKSLADDARARIVDADARSTDADAQTRHAETGIEAAKAHMEAARLHMAAANHAEADAHALQERADDQMAEAASLLADRRDDDVEYQRAIYHYTQLVRHRMANPLQTICGMSKMLHDLPELDPVERQKMICHIYEQAQVLERVCLEPEIMNDTERELRPRPFT